jgi:hypothetical protein
VILNLNEELNNCSGTNSSNQSVVPTMPVIDLKLDFHKSQGPFHQASPSFKSAREKRRSDIGVKTNAVADSSLQWRLVRVGKVGTA